MRLRSFLWVGLLCSGLVACSDDDTKPLDSGPDKQVADTMSDMGVDQQSDVKPHLDLAPDTQTPDQGAPDEGTPDMGVDALPPDTLAPDTMAPDTMAPDTMVADTMPPDTLSPDLGPPQNGTCAAAQRLTLVNGKAVAAGDTSTFSNEYSSMTCSGSVASMDGPQAYYVFTGAKDVWYKLTLDNQMGSYSAYLYIFTNSVCAKTAIQGDCSSGGTTGAGSGAVSGGSARSVYFKPSAAGDIRFAVDSQYSWVSGAFTVTVEEVTLPQNSTCTQAQALSFTNNKVKMSGETAPGVTPNELAATVNCGGTTSYSGPQVYYRFTAAPNTNYRIALKSVAAKGLRYYLFAASSCPASGGVAAQINADCGSAGDGALFGNDIYGTGTMVWTAPSTGGDWILAVDSTGPGNYGSFELEIEKGYAPPQNATCLNAQALTMVNGRAMVNGDTAGAADESGGSIKCGGYSTFDAPQTYYKFTPQAGKVYKVTLTPEYDAALSWFLAGSCGTAADIDNNCKSKGQSGDAKTGIAAGQDGSLLIRNITDAVVISVDGTTSTAAGRFALSVEELPPPSNDTCASASAMTFIAGKALVTGDTRLATNTLSMTSSSCVGKTTPHPELFYSLPVQADTSYKVKLSTGSGYAGALYVLDGCGAASTCLGGAAKSYSGNSSEEVIFYSASAGNVIIGVDSGSSSYPSGSFTLEVEVFPTAANNSCAGATPITLTGGTAIITGDTSSELNTIDLSGCTGADSKGKDMFYSLAVTANTTYELKLKSTGFDGVLFLLDSCSTSPETACFRGANAGGSYTTEKIVFTASQAGTVIVGVDASMPSTYSGSGGAFTLDVAELAAPAAGDTCGSAIAMSFVAGKAQVTGDNSALNDYLALPSAASCTSNSLSGKDMFYSVPVTAGTVYRAKLTPPSFTDMSLYVLPGCDSEPNQNCVAGADNNTGFSSDISETVTFTAKQSGTMILVVDAKSSSSSGSFTLEVDELTVAGNDFCSAATAIVLSNGSASLTGDTSATGVTNAISMGKGSCAGKAMQGPDQFYSLAVVAGRSYAIDLTPAAGYDAALYIFDDCATPRQSCQGSVDAGTSGKKESLFFNAKTTGTLFIAADAANNYGNKGAFTLEVTEIAAAPSTLHLQEVGVGNIDYVTLKNTGTAPVQLRGVQVFIPSQTSYGTDIRVDLPTQTLAAGATLTIVDGGAQPGEITVSNLPWTETSDFSVQLCFGACSETDGSNVMDAALFGTAATALPTGVGFSGGPVSGIAPAQVDTHAYVRNATAGAHPTFLASDWTVGASTR